MSLFEFIVGMISVLIALAIVQLLIGLGRLVQARGKVITYLPHTFWNANLFIPCTGGRCGTSGTSSGTRRGSSSA